MLLKSLFVGLFLITSLYANIMLPVHSVKYQSNTFHCWAYATSHLLEVRSLLTNHMNISINTEKDVKYWVDFERMFYVYKSKKDFYLGDNEGGWQIEFWETFIKHGKHIQKALGDATPTVPYAFNTTYSQHLPFMNEPRPKPDPTLMSFDMAKNKLREMNDDNTAVKFILDYLNRLYGLPLMTTKWLGDTAVSIQDSARLILGNDFESNQYPESMVLVKPVDDGVFGWVRYLNERFWGYRYDKNQILTLIEKSLNNGWPVTFDNVYHAMTIIGYGTNNLNETSYAIIDSGYGNIVWYNTKKMLANLNLVTFMGNAIPYELPSISKQNYLYYLNKNIDRIDNVEIPPM